MLRFIAKTFFSAPYINEITDKKIVEKKYKYWRIRIFYSIYLGYVFFYFTRKSFTFTMPIMVDELGFSKATLGFLGSVLYISYGISKFVSGVLSDKANPRYFMATGLILTGVFNILFGLSSSVFFFSIFWGLNGVFQGWGWPPCTKQLTYWFSHHERGFWWSVKSTSHNVGGALIPIVVAFAASKWDWRWGMYIPGITGIIVGLILLERLRDVPQTLGLPPIDQWSRAPDSNRGSNQENSLSFKQILVDQVLANGTVWLLALCYFFVYVVRIGFNDWAAMYLHKIRNYPMIDTAGVIAWFEGGGFFGTIAAGWISDSIFNGKRIPYMLFCSVGLLVVIPVFWLLERQLMIVDCVLMAIIGFLIFGPQMLVGLAAAEFVDKKAACAANGFAGCFAYVGAAATGYPLGKAIDIWNWQGFFVTMILSSAITILVLIPLGKIRHHP